MAHTVELVADTRLESTVRSLWQRLAEAGVPSQAQHTHASNRPHVTVTRCELARPVLLEVLAAAAESLPAAARLTDRAYLGAGHRRTLVAVVCTSGELLALHSRVHDLVVAAGAVPDRQYWPDRWLPHVTLARRLDVHQQDRARRILPDTVCAEGQWASVRSYDERTRGITTA